MGRTANTKTSSRAPPGRPLDIQTVGISGGAARTPRGPQRGPRRGALVVTAVTPRMPGRFTYIGEGVRCLARSAMRGPSETPTVCTSRRRPGGAPALWGGAHIGAWFVGGMVLERTWDQSPLPPLSPPTCVAPPTGSAIRPARSSARSSLPSSTAAAPRTSVRTTSSRPSLTPSTRTAAAPPPTSAWAYSSRPSSPGSTRPPTPPPGPCSPSRTTRSSCPGSWRSRRR
mmetsp:Transcript_13013/g.41100  ORF Transcript_13013/g.41100 Transcript_13013/m.41100 type:complete len:228 (-) Transcript_13013:46-729(-)